MTEGGLVGFSHAATYDANTVGRTLQRNVSVTDPPYNAIGDGAADDTAAIQAAINASNNVYFPGTRAGRKYKFSNLTVKLRTRLYGDGPRASVLRQTAGSTGAALTLEAGLPPAGYGINDISEGAYRFEAFGIEVASATGLKVPSASLASMISSDNFRLEHRQAEANMLVSPPYSVVAGSKGIEIDAGGSGANFVSNHQNIEIRAFETAVYCRNGPVNEQRIHGWFIDNKVGIDAQTISSWKTEIVHESGVANARCYKLDGAVSNLIILDSRWELTQSGCYGIEWGASIAAQNIRTNWQNVLILGDGSAIPGRKWTGTPPEDWVLTGYELDVTDAEIRPFMVVPGNVPHRMPTQQRIGGQGVGNGKIILGRDADNGGKAVIENDGTYLNLSMPNGVKLPDAGGASAHSTPLWLGGYAVWVDNGGILRIKSGFPANNTDGTIVGTQT